MDPDYKRKSTRGFLEAEFTRNQSSRAEICDKILRPYLSSDSHVLDLGCGPGFLAKHVSKLARRVFAADISPGVLACARLINGADNIIYLESNEMDYGRIEDDSLDLVYSFAVIQHVTDEVFAEILDVTRAKMKPGANAVFHVVVEYAAWKNEQEWMEDRSLKGKFLLRYALNCFSRTKDQVRTRFREGGLVVKQDFRASEIAPDLKDDIRDQHIFVVQKDPGNIGAPMTDGTPAGKIAGPGADTRR